MKEVAMIFDKDCQCWINDRDSNLWYLKNVEDHLNGNLEICDWLCLNDVFDCLNMPRTKSGQKYGWKKGEKIKFETVTTKYSPDIKITIRNLVNILE